MGLQSQMRPSDLAAHVVKNGASRTVTLGPVAMFSVLSEPVHMFFSTAKEASQI